MNHTINFIDNPSLKGREDKFIVIQVNLKKIIKSWRKSLLSFEWLDSNGVIHDEEKLPDTMAKQFQHIKQRYENNDNLERPVLGFGIMDNIEIGSRKDVLLTLHKLGVDVLDVHIPKNDKEDFQKFI